MANKGSYAAYRQLTPLGNGISEDIQYWNNDGYKRRAEDRIEDKLKAEREEKKKAEKDALFEKVNKNLQNYDTGSKSLNEIQGRLLQEAMQEYIPIMEILSNPDVSDQERLKAQIKLDALHNLPENMKVVTESVSKKHAAYLEGIKSGTLFRDQKYEDLFQNGYESFALSLDDYGNPVLAYRDKDGDGVFDVESYEEIKSNTGGFEFQPKYNTDALAVKAAGEIGEEDKTTGSTYKTIQTKQIKLEQVATYAKNTMVDEKGELTPVAKSELRSRNLEPTQENIDKITKDFEELIISKSDYLKKENYEAAALTSRLNAKDKDKPTSRVGEPVKPSKGNWGAWYENIDTSKNLSVPVEGVKVESIRTNKGETISGYNITNYTLDNENQLILDGYVQEEKTITREDFTKQKAQALEDNDQLKLTMLSYGKIDGDKVIIPGAQKKKQVRVNKEDESSIALQLGVSIEELRSMATIPQEKEEKNNNKPIFN